MLVLRYGRDQGSKAEADVCQRWSHRVFTGLE
jgi:hypothetical protein